MAITERTREEYRNRFKNEFIWVRKEGEEIVQCNAHYPAYYFISNKAYLISLAGRVPKIIKPRLESGKHEQKYWIKKDGVYKNVKLHQLVAEHFCNKEFPLSDGDSYDVHHIRGKANFTEDQPQECNQASNLQWLPQTIHKRATEYSKKTDSQRMAELEKKIQESGAPEFQVNQKLFFELLKAGIRTGRAISYSPDSSNNSIEVHPLASDIPCEWIDDPEEEEQE